MEMISKFFGLCLVSFALACNSVIDLRTERVGHTQDDGTGGTVTTSSTTSSTTSEGGAGGTGGSGGNGPECTSNEDCAHFDGECLVFKCMAGSCFAFERDDDNDGHSSCGGLGTPEAYDCNDHDPSIYPGAAEVCSTNIDHNCNGKVEEGCWEFCSIFAPTGETQACCALNGTFPTTDQPQAGQLITAPFVERVYYFASDGKRYVFPTTTVLVSWYGNYDQQQIPIDDPSVCGKVVEIPVSVLANIPIGGNVTLRPGTYVTGIQTDPKRYAVSKLGVLHLIPNDAIGVAIFGSSYYDRYRVTADAFFVNYMMGAALASPLDYNLPAEFAVSIEQSIGLVP